jgi:FAD/FMN-containing dehydrogenase
MPGEAVNGQSPSSFSKSSRKAPGFAPEYLSWGRYPIVEHNSIFQVSSAEEVPSILASCGSGACLPRGLGRSYGDSCLNAGRGLLDCTHLSRILAFDDRSGRIRCEGGVSFAAIIEAALARGWFLPVTPGTKFVTVGGAIANDVHGKNHHRSGTFGAHLERIAVCRSDRGIVECSPRENAELFRATVGGLGLTGVILWAEFRLRQVAGTEIESETIAFQSMEEFEAISQESDSDFEYTVAWIDCFCGPQTRGIFFRGNHGKRESSGEPRTWRQMRAPIPRFLLAPQAIAAFNAAYYHWNAWRAGQRTVSLHSFFYPLDAVRDWNRAYGKSGFLQYQCVVPDPAASTIEEMLKRVRAENAGAFLAVLKRFGNLKSPGLLSFPRPGLTLALDFPMRGKRTLRLLDSLDRIVSAAQGSVYPAKDARMSAEMFEKSFPQWREFERWVDPAMSSSFWRRVNQGPSPNERRPTQDAARP